MTGSGVGYRDSCALGVMVDVDGEGLGMVLVAVVIPCSDRGSSPAGVKKP